MTNSSAKAPVSAPDSTGPSVTRNSGRMVRVQRLVRFVQDLDLIQTIGALTLVLAVIFGFDHWAYRMVLLTGFVVFAVRPSSLRSPLFWLVLALAGTTATVLQWERVDNHKYLLDYWLWLLFIVQLFRLPEHQRQFIRFNARFFLCLIFLVASGQKLLSPSYRSGALFEHYLYVDPRFTAFGKLVGIDPSVPDAVKKTYALMRSPFGQVEGNELDIPGSDRARVAALTMTWWDVSFQLLIGLLLLFRRTGTDQLAHVLLLFFILTTYLPAPVYGFGWILAIMGFSLAKDRFPRIATAYFLTFFAIVAYQLPWRDWVLSS